METHGRGLFPEGGDIGQKERYCPVHYTPVRLEGKLHNEALDFGGSYYFTVDASVAGKAVERADFTTKAKPSGTTLKVAEDGSADFCTVQGALSYATTLGKNDAVTIEVADGTYRELLNDCCHSPRRLAYRQNSHSCHSYGH